MSTDDKVRAQIEEAVEALPVKRLELVALAVDTLTCIASPPSVPVGNRLSFNSVGRPRVERQLTGLVELADGDLAGLAKLTADLRAPVITLLANNGWLQQDRNPAHAQAAALAALKHVQSGKWKAPKADRGRPAKLREDGITAIAAGHYKALTGKEPGRSRLNSCSADPGKPTGPFYRFLKEIFTAAGIVTDPMAAIERHQRKKKKLQSPVNWRECSWLEIEEDWYLSPDRCNKDRSIAHVYRSGRFWCAKLIRPTHRAGWAAFAIVRDAPEEALNAARGWVEKELAKDERFRRRFGISL